MTFLINNSWNLYKIIYETPLIKAIEIGNIEIIKLLLSKPNIDVNMKSI